MLVENTLPENISPSFSVLVMVPERLDTSQLLEATWCRKVTRDGVDGIPAVPAPVAKGTRTIRGEEQHKKREKEKEKRKKKKEKSLNITQRTCGPYKKS